MKTRDTLIESLKKETIDLKNRLAEYEQTYTPSPADYCFKIEMHQSVTIWYYIQLIKPLHKLLSRYFWHKKIITNHTLFYHISGMITHEFDNYYISDFLKMKFDKEGNILPFDKSEIIMDNLPVHIQEQLSKMP